MSASKHMVKSQRVQCDAGNVLPGRGLAVGKARFG